MGGTKATKRPHTLAHVHATGSGCWLAKLWPEDCSQVGLGTTAEQIPELYVRRFSRSSEGANETTTIFHLGHTS